MTSPIESGVRYDAAHAKAYERKIRSLILGYDALHELSAHLLRVMAPSTARILVSGSGTGEELARYYALGRDWDMAGVEPSAEMNTHARERLAAGLAQGRIRLVQGDMRHADCGADYDAATSLLVMHFLQQDAKAAYLDALAMAIRPGGLLLLADLTGDRQDDAFKQLHAAWRSQQDAARDRPDQIELDFAHLERNVHPLSTSCRAQMLADAGFEECFEYWRTLGLVAIVARRVS